MELLSRTQAGDRAAGLRITMEHPKNEQAFGHGRGPSAHSGTRRSRPPSEPRVNSRSSSTERESPNDRLDRIVAAATAAFARDGYHKATMRQIAQEGPDGPGVGLAGMYHYVDSKERLLFLIQFRAFSGLLTEVTAKISGVDDPVEQLRHLIHTHVHYVASDMATLKVCSHELDSLTGEVYEQVRRVRRQYYDLARSIVARIIEEARSSPADRTVDPRVDLSSRGGLDERVATMSLFGTLNWIYRWYDPDQGRSPASLANQIFAQFLAGLLGTLGDPAPRKKRGSEASRKRAGSSNNRSAIRSADTGKRD